LEGGFTDKRERNGRISILTNNKPGPKPVKSKGGGKGGKGDTQMREFKKVARQGRGVKTVRNAVLKP